jgi:hypothetical protein
MKPLKLLVLVLGIVGIVAVFLPHTTVLGHTMKFWDAREAEPVNVYLTVGGFALAIVVAVAGVAKAPFGRLHALLALVGFGAQGYAYRDHLGGLLDLFKQGEIGAKLLLGAGAVGVVAALVGLLAPER